MSGAPPSQELILASASPRRQELLALAGVPHRVEVSQIPEDLQAGESAAEYTQRLALAKARDVAGRCPAEAWVLGADTTVVIDGGILGKPRDEEDGRRMLGLLSDRSHQVLTAVALIRRAGDRSLSLLSETEVTFRRLHPDLIDAYLATGEPLDKAGAYGIQGQGAMLVRTIRGSYTNVVGLPLCETVGLLERAQVWRPFSGGSR